MSLSGSFRLDPRPHRVGGPIPLVLRVCNVGDDPLFVFVPRGRADGVRLRVLSGQGLQLEGLECEPEPGLVPEIRLDPGECHEQTYPLGNWIARGDAGPHLLECQIEIEMAGESLQRPGRRAPARRVLFVETVPVTLAEPAS